MDYTTRRLVAMKRVRFDDRVEREIRMLLLVENLSDVPCPREFIFRFIISYAIRSRICIAARSQFYTARSQD